MLSDVAARVIELKKMVRHVRTPEGVRKYGLPIGSPIVARARDVLGRTKAKKVPGKPIVYAEQVPGSGGLVANEQQRGRARVPVKWGKPGFNQASYGAVAVANLPNNGGQYAVYRMKNGEYTVYLPSRGTDSSGQRTGFASEADARAWVEKDAMQYAAKSTSYGKPIGKRDKYGVQWRNPLEVEHNANQTLIGDHEDGRKFVIYKSPNSGYYSVIIKNKYGDSTGSMNNLTSQAAAKKAAQDFLAKEEATRPKRVKRDYPNFFDYYEGVYGYDWTWGDEDPRLLAKTEDESKGVSNKARRTLAIRESHELGITVNGNAAGKVDVAAHENINAVMRSYEAMYPGFSNFNPNFNLDGGPSDRHSVNAYNVLVGARWSPKVDANGVERDWSYTEIGLGYHIFGEGFDDARVGQYAVSATRSRWSSIDTEDIANKTGMDDWQIGHLRTLNHELGHTVARVALGELSTKQTDTFGNKRTFLNELYEIMDRYGAIKETHRIAEGEHSPLGNDIHDNASFNTGAVKAHVSEYAATNVHELAAESWASYMLDDSPTEMVVEIAQLMEWYLFEFMKSEFPEEERYRAAS